MRAGWLAVAALLVLLAGCAEAPARAAPAEADHGRFAWTGCDAAGVGLDGPTAVYAGSVPPGWEDPLDVVNQVQLTLHRCERVSWGPFERGPVTILLERHLAFAEPDACRGGSKLGAMLQSIWFGDPELAAYARDRHGMPARAAEFRVRELGPVAGSEWEWAWAEPGGKESRVVLGEPAGGASGTVPENTLRLFWPNGSRVSLLDLTRTFDGDGATLRLAHGVLQPPLLHGSMPVPDFATSQASRHSDEQAAATIVHFQDAACLEPA